VITATTIPSIIPDDAIVVSSANSLYPSLSKCLAGTILILFLLL
jgi:hypothetical protein